MRNKMVSAMIGWVLWGSVGDSLSAQTVLGEVVPPVRQVRVERKADSLAVHFQWAMDSLHLSSNRSCKFQPVLVGGDSVCVLKPVVIAGRRQAIMHVREQREGQLVRHGKAPSSRATYRDVVVYREWMNGAELRLMQDLCGCGGHPLSQHLAARYEVWVEIPDYVVQPTLAFVSPKAEVVKLRAEKGQAFLDFPVNQTVIHPQYRQNPVELQKIQQTVELIQHDSNTRITQIDIHGYASPEGSWANNRRLAHGRAWALKEYVGGLYHLEDTIFQVTSTPEDWAGLQAWVEQSTWPQKSDILHVLATVKDEDARNAALQRLDAGKVYARLLKEVYPSLRHSDYTVHYTVRAFQLEEARQLLKTRPQLLSLQEMYEVASSYPVGSEDFLEVFDIAVRLFPEDEIANLNVALALIHRADYPQAARYLKKAGSSPEAIHARGVWYLMTEQYDEAERLLRQAAELGVKEATDNLHQWQLKQENRKKQLNINE